MKLLVVDAVGLRPADLATAPRLHALANEGFMAPLTSVFPAVTCSAQATFLTGTPPRDHGVVGNGWYFRDLAQVWLWRQSNHLVHGEKVYQVTRRRGRSTAKLFWWFNMYADVDWSVTPRPEYHADGLKVPGLYSNPPGLAGEIERRLGPFPLFQFWGPAADIRSTRWITDCALAVMEQHDPDLQLVYLPHLDYDHQRFGPDHPRSRAAVAALDVEAGRLVAAAQDRGARVIVLSEYGIEAVNRPIFVNRALREHGFLRIQATSHGELLDAGASRAFAVADHQIAHVYVRDPADLAEVKRLIQSLDGVAHLLDRREQAGWDIDHERSGELVAVSDATSWFAYHYWLDEDRRPDFAPTVDIHRKPGYDPTELFIDPKLRWPRLRVFKNLAKKILGFRYLMDVIGTDPTIVRGSHGRRIEDPDRGPLFIDSSRDAASDRVHSLEVKDRILAALG